MLTMIRFELKKMLIQPLSLMLILMILAVNGIVLLLNSEGNIVNLQDIEMQRVEQSQYAGEINEGWSNLIQEKLKEIRENPDNLMSETEKAEVQQEYLQRGYTQEYVDGMSNTAFLKPEILNGLSYNILLDAESSSEFYDHAQQFADIQGRFYSTVIEGRKGEALASKAEAMYGYLAQDYIAYYNYNLGWLKLSFMQSLMPFTVGLFLIVTISTIFSKEYSQKTESLLLSTKYGKSRLIYAKLLASFILAIGFWLTLQVMNLLVIAWLFSLQGAETFVQDWLVNSSPFAFTQLTNYIAVSVVSLIGVICFTSVIILVSAKTKSSFASILISSIVLLFPVIISIPNTGGVVGSFVGESMLFMPVRVLIATNYFTFFRAYYIFGNIILMQWIVPMVAILSSALMVPIAFRRFKRHQVEN
ncbi:ABC-2 family transporter protein [Clostridium aceticum]|uniref:ABC-2 family transporter protein n=1 Tax=Clostridium aceticum TaxID=84022 RepID=A0A0D8IDS8_9CLOT|nr:ABC transporter permease subunit [Clostridium aceticum]AKL96497.1 ABC-2 family transporter protein [Clostridium aceticum]KJF27331.1 hypothetical protein TZ02_08320 [Clostridium aceticum]